MLCPRCGYLNRPQARFCAHCRTPLTAAPPQPYPPTYPSPAYPPSPGPPSAYSPPPIPARKRPVWLWVVAVGVVLAALAVLCLGCGCLAVLVGPGLWEKLISPTATPRPPTPITPSATPRPPTPTPPVVTPVQATATPRPPTPTLTRPPSPTPTRPPSPTATQPPAPVGLEIGHTAPGFTLQDLDGKTVNLSDYRGRPVLLNFWATWCGPCRSEMADLQAAYSQYQAQGFTILAVNLEENPDTVRAFMQRQSLTFPALLDSDGQVGKRYKVQAIPTSYFLDRQGVIRDKQVGSMNRGRIEAGINQIIK